MGLVGYVRLVEIGGSCLLNCLMLTLTLKMGITSVPSLVLGGDFRLDHNLDLNSKKDACSYLLACLVLSCFVCMYV